MQLIKKIEINYLRSIYSANLDKVGDLNLFFGRNDSGKSNILRALNLFFNEEAEPGQEFDFHIDMSDLRKQKASEAKGRQFVWIKITFNVPPNYQNALGKEVSIKKQWNRDGAVTTTTSPSFSSGKAGRLSRFLNEIDFTYIPAIKDLAVYADLIERMYSSASENSEMLTATNSFITAIGGQTKVLTDQLTSIFGGTTLLSPPTDMATLFRNLDFSHGEERHSLFKQKGDGVKARHLPELLRFINEHEPGIKFFIWGFEEPENSLDLSAATSEAKRFADFSARNDTQIFVSSHSPAFYLASSTGPTTIERFFVQKQTASEDGAIKPERATRKINDLGNADEMMSAAGLLQLPYVIRKLDDQRKELEDNKKLSANLTKQLGDLQRPTLLLEGKWDIKYFQKLFKLFDIGKKIDIRQVNGTPNNSSAFLNAVSDAGGIGASSKTAFLFDNDKSGRASLKALCGKAAVTDGTSFGKVGDNISAGVLPFHRELFIKFISECGLSEDRIKFPFELMFVDSRTLEFSLDKTSHDKDWLCTIHDDYYKQGQKLNVRMQKFEPGTSGWLYSRMVPDYLKDEYLKLAFSNINANDSFLKEFVSTIETAMGV